MDTTATVYVVDEDAVTRASVRTVVSAMNLRYEEYPSGHQFLAGFDPTQPGCVVLEVKIPGVSGLQIQRQLADRGYRTPLVFLTAQATVSIAVQALRHGAVHFLQKPAREHELWDAIAEAIQCDRSRHEALAGQQQARCRLSSLTPDESALLRMVLEGKSNKAIAPEIGVCLRTVEARRSKAMKKLKVRSLAELVSLVLASGDGQALIGRVLEPILAPEPRPATLPRHLFPPGGGTVESAWGASRCVRPYMRGLPQHRLLGGQHTATTRTKQSDKRKRNTTQARGTHVSERGMPP